MRVFISWSGPKSRSVAEVLSEWLQEVIQAIDPWMSAADTEKGVRWRSVISTQLEESDFGIVCLTRDNLESPWLLFEAGALSKLQQASRVCTFLLDVESGDVRDPLGQFQSTVAERTDVLKLIETINAALGDDALDSRKLERAFRRTWPELDRKLKRISKMTHQHAQEPDLPTMVAEILGYVRTLSHETAEMKSRPTGLTTAELVLLGKILATNQHLNVSSLSESQLQFEDGTHGTLYRINRRALSTFLRRLRKEAQETRELKKKR